MSRNWRDSASCLGTDLVVWFPEGGPGVHIDTSVAKSVCHNCPVRVECLDDAMALERGQWDRYGIRGEMSAPERRKLAKSRRGAEPTQRADRADLEPCRTSAEYHRHLRRREPIDDACRGAERSRTAERARKEAVA